jgi:hypothetical protein
VFHRFCFAPRKRSPACEPINQSFTRTAGIPIQKSRNPDTTDGAFISIAEVSQWSRVGQLAMTFGLSICCPDSSLADTCLSDSGAWRRLSIEDRPDEIDGKISDGPRIGARVIEPRGHHGTICTLAIRRKAQRLIEQSRRVNACLRVACHARRCLHETLFGNRIAEQGGPTCCICKISLRALETIVDPLRTDRTQHLK